MNYDTLQTLLATSPVVKLLRAKNAPLILSFLHKAFKEPNKITIPHYQLADALADYLDAIQFFDDTDDTPGDSYQKAKHYLDSWCDTQNNYLRKFPDENGDDVHELTPSTERILQWVQDLEQKAFIGTESIFLDIIRRLKELHENSTEEPEQKIAALLRQREEIDAQIAEIRASGVVRVFNDTQIKERFYEINRSARGLLADFREVEQNFREIVRNIYKKHAENVSKKGEILSYVLDETDALKLSDQGTSFYTFWHVLMDQTRREDLDSAVDRIYQLLDERDIEYADAFLRNMKFYLLEAGKKVVDTNHLLVEKLKRILAGQKNVERKRAMTLISEIKHQALRVIDTPPDDDEFLEIEGEPYLNLLMERPLGEQTQEAAFEHHPLEFGGSDLTHADFSTLLRPFDVNKEELAARITQYLKHRKQAALTDILREHPITNGLAELLTYFSIASQSSKHLINADKYDIIELQSGSGRTIKIPQIIFTNGAGRVSMGR